jgi:hypothetical protein
MYSTLREGAVFIWTLVIETAPYAAALGFVIFLLEAAERHWHLSHEANTWLMICGVGCIIVVSQAHGRIRARERREREGSVEQAYERGYEHGQKGPGV